MILSAHPAVRGVGEELDIAGHARSDGRVRCVVQRVLSAQVRVRDVVVGAIERGLVALVCAMEGDEQADEAWLVRRLLTLRVFADDAGKMNRSVVEVGGGLLVVSQFTLAADIAPGKSKGNRPSFGGAASPVVAEPAMGRVVAALREQAPSLRVETGQFGADMQLSLVNDGPVTLWLDSRGGVRGELGV